MNICMNISQLYSPQGGIVAGGNINAMLALSEGLSRLGHSLTILSGWPHRHSSDEVRAELANIKLELFQLRTTGPLLRNIEFLSRLVRTAYKLRSSTGFEIVHGHSGYPHLSIMTVLLKRILNVPAVYTLYCPVTDRLNDRAHLLLKTTVFVRSCLLQMDCLVAISENIRRSLENLNIPNEKVVMIRPSIRQCRIVTQNERSALRHKLGVAPGQKMILFVGNFTRAKGLDLLIRAFAKVKQKLRHVKLVYAVERGPKISDEREKEVRTLLTDTADTIELGIVSDIPLLMSSSDLFVLPFRETNGPMDYPMALMEAMAAGSAVIATRVGAIDELIRDGETGLLVDACNAEGLAQAMLTVLTNESLRLLIAQQAKIETLQKLTQEQAARKMEKIYEQVLCAHHRYRA